MIEARFAEISRIWELLRLTTLMTCSSVGVGGKTLGYSPVVCHGHFGGQLVRCWQTGPPERK